MATLAPDRPALTPSSDSRPGAASFVSRNASSASNSGSPAFTGSAMMAVITAAVHCVLQGRPHQIAFVAPIEPLDWAREGRRIIWHSHKLR